MGRRKDVKYLNETAARSLIPKAYTAQCVPSEVTAHSHVNHFDLESKSKIELDQFWTTLGDRPTGDAGSPEPIRAARLPRPNAGSQPPKKNGWPG